MIVRVLESTLAHLSGALEQAEQTRRSRWDPRVKVVGALLLTVAAISARRWEILLCLLILLSAAAGLSGISWRRLLSGWAGGLFFAAIIAVPAVFSSGWQLALVLVLRSEVSLTCWLIVVLTTPFNLVLNALQALYVPAVFIAILSMTFRYIFLLVHTAQDMLLSRRSRLVARMSGAQQRRLLSSSAAVLLGKSIHMSDDVYQAMVSRGFRGEIRVMQNFQMTMKDWRSLAAVTALATAVFVAGR